MPIAPQATVAAPPNPATTMQASLVTQLTAIRGDLSAVDTDRQALVARLAAAAPTTLTAAVTQLRELQDFARKLDVALERVQLATLRLARLVAGQLDGID